MPSKYLRIRFGLRTTNQLVSSASNLDNEIHLYQNRKLYRQQEGRGLSENCKAQWEPGGKELPYGPEKFPRKGVGLQV